MARKKAKCKATLRHEAALRYAKKTAPGSSFVASCHEFYEANGFLSVRQVEALENVTPPRENSGYYPYDMPEEFGFPPDEHDFGDWGDR